MRADLSILEKLEEKYNFIYPTVYKQLFQDGMLEYNADESLLDNNIASFELITFKQIDDVLCELPRYRRGNIKYNIVPFGMDAGGNNFAFCYDFKVNEDIPIIIASKDGCPSIILAKNLSDFIFREFIENIPDCVDELEETGLTKDELKETILKSLEKHKKYLESKKYEFLLKFYKKPLTDISYEEIDDILDEMISFDRLNEEFDIFA